MTWLIGRTWTTGNRRRGLRDVACLPSAPSLMVVGLATRFPFQDSHSRVCRSGLRASSGSTDLADALRRMPRKRPPAGRLARSAKLKQVITHHALSSRLCGPRRGARSGGERSPLSARGSRREQTVAQTIVTHWRVTQARLSVACTLPGLSVYSCASHALGPLVRAPGAMSRVAPSGLGYAEEYRERVKVPCPEHGRSMRGRWPERRAARRSVASHGASIV